MEHTGVTTICPKFHRNLSLYYPGILFDVQAAQERENLWGSNNKDTKRHPANPNWTLWMPTSKGQLIFMYLNPGYC